LNDNLKEQINILPDYFQGHVLLTLAALFMGVSISVPLGIWAAETPKVKRPLLAVVSIIQTIPSLAILALVVALLGGRIGFLPAFLALTLYSMLPIVRNTVTGLESVADDVVEAARGIGMTSRQILTKVRLPLALPIIIAGIRTATVWTVGLATLSTIVGATSFGNYIFTGIQTRNLTSVIIGSIASAVLAVVLDSAIGGIQWTVEQRMMGARQKFSTRTKFAAAAIAVVVVAATTYGLASKSEADYIVGAKGFTEQYIIAGLIAAQLEDAGYEVEQLTGLGTEIIYEAARNNSVDAYLEYTGTVWANHMNREDNPGREAIRDSTMTYLEEQSGLVNVGPFGFQNLYALAMRKDRAAELGVKTVEDLISIADTLVCGADLEFFGRPEWHRLRDLYAFDFDKKLTFDTALMYTAVNERQVDLITAYTTDGRVAAYDLLILEDPRNALLPYDGLLVASPRAGDDPAFMEALRPLVGAISDESMREANKIVDVDGRPLSDAVDYLKALIKN